MPTYVSLIDRVTPIENTDASLSIPTQLQRESDVIISSVILGFAATRYYLNQPCAFDVELETLTKTQRDDPERDENGLTLAERWDAKNAYEQQEFVTVMSCVSDVLDRYQGGMGDWVKDGQSQKEGKGEVITGRAGGATTKSNERDKSPKSWRTKELIKNLAENDWAIANRIYIGRGAYTGIYDDEVDYSGNYSYQDGSSTRPTLRVFRNDTDWLPVKTAGDNSMPWGIVGGADEDGKFHNLASISNSGMGPLPGGNEANGKRKLGYIHGLCGAVHMCSENGAWTTPYEVATGDHTTKIASCFPCTTFLYSAGHPPSSTHIGRGESWVPPIKEDQVATEPTSYPVDLSPNEAITDGNNFYNNEDCDTFKSLWDDDICDYMRLGIDIVLEGITREDERLEHVLTPDLEAHVERLTMVDDEYLNTFEALQTLASSFEGHPKELSSRFLDALTIHDSEWKRLKRTFNPLYTRKRIKELLISGNVQIIDQD